jgi:hypothetical protein
MRYKLMVCAGFAAAYIFCVSVARAQVPHSINGNDLERTGLIPRYPENSGCSPLTSLYASWDDVDGTERNQVHSGVDGGRLGDTIRSPAPGTIKAVWKANWGWGEDGALLVRHTIDDLTLATGPKYYYSEFDHLKYGQIQSLTEGSKIVRGQKLATVSRPGGNEEYLPEVHWEVWMLADDSINTWHTNKYGGRYWTNESAHLIDPLYMLSRNVLPREDGSVDIHPYDAKENYSTYKGFTYILPCGPKKMAEQTHAAR